MVPFTVSDFLTALRARAVDAAGACFARQLMRLPLWLLLALERRGVPGLGWAIFARDMERDDERPALPAFGLFGIRQRRELERRKAAELELQRAIEADEQAWIDSDRGR